MPKDFIRSPIRRSRLIQIARECKKLRLELGYTQYDVADEVRTTSANICEFENARNDSATIMLWYVQHGLNIGLID